MYAAGRSMTIPADHDPADTRGVAFDEIPVNDDTRPDAELVEKIRRHLPYNPNPANSHD